MLKTAAFALALWYAAVGIGGAGEPTVILVGTLRDTAGRPVVAALVRAFDSRGGAVGTDRSAEDGTFAIAVSAVPATLNVDCDHCRGIRIALHGHTSVALIVTQYVALQSATLTSQDLAALPYGRIADDLALIPFVLPSLDRTNVSDRGLGGGRGLAIDDGVPIVDTAIGTSGLSVLPDRYVRSVNVQRHDAAFRYGSYSAGGTFSLDRFSDEGSWSSADLGVASAFAVAPQLGAISPAYGESNDDGVFARRADFDANGSFGGGRFRGGIGAGAQTVSASSGDIAANSNVAYLDYATASRRYRTFVDAAAEDLVTEQLPHVRHTARAMSISARASNTRGPSRSRSARTFGVKPHVHPSTKAARPTSTLRQRRTFSPKQTPVAQAPE